MTNQHPITPSPELVQQWIRERDGLEHIATQAARWGADQELDACCEWLDDTDVDDSQEAAKELRAARRPKPPSLKEQALKELEILRGDLSAHGLGFEAPAVRRALEALPD